MAALLVSIAYLILATLVLDAYGPTWDCSAGDYAYGEATWNALLHGQDPVEVYKSGSVVTQRQPHPAFESHFVWVQLFPLAATLSAVSCDLFWSWLGWLSPMAAHHIVISLFVAILLYVLVLFLGRQVGPAGGMLAAAFLVASPRFFAHAQNNLKDMPEACLYSLCAMAFYTASSRRNVRGWLAVGALAALALAQKQNALFLPIQFGLTASLFWLLIPAERAWRKRALLPGVAIGLGAFAVTYLLVSPWSWADMTRLPQHWHEYFVVGGSGTGPVSLDGPYQVLITTPIPLLVLGVVGMFARRANPRLRIFLIAWVGTAIGRLLLPGMRNFDGVRHFLEFYPPLAMLSALGLQEVFYRFESLELPPAVVQLAVSACSLLPGAIATASTHPNGVCYFNAVIGGLQGATERHLPEAADYWGNSYWQGLDWLDEHAPKDAQVLAPISPQIVRAGSYRLRQDLSVVEDDIHIGVPLCVIYTTHEGYYGPLIRHLETSGTPSMQIDVQGAPILRIHVFEGDEVADLAQRWKRERNAQQAIARVVAWAQGQSPSRAPEIMKIVTELPDLGLEESIRRLQAILPPSLHQDGADLLWWKQARSSTPSEHQK